MWSVIILFWLLLPFTSLRNVSIMLPIIEWCESNFPTCLEQSALFWHQAVGYSVGKIDVFWKTFDKVRGKIEKIITISYHLHLNSISTCNWLNIQKMNKKIAPDCGLLVLRYSSFLNILIILTILLLSLCHCCPAQESLALKG